MRVANRQRITNDLSTIKTAGSTANLFAGLKEAYEFLQSVSARKKHVIVISNAAPAEDGVMQLVDDMRAARITVSTLAGPKAGRELLAKVAKAGDGRSYAVGGQVGLLEGVGERRLGQREVGLLAEAFLPASRRGLAACL